jgi:hypothetical protein
MRWVILLVSDLWHAYLMMACEHGVRVPHLNLTLAAATESNPYLANIISGQ